jgi:alkylhydroperoxidase family enzyme
MAYLDRNLPFIRNWQIMRDHSISLDSEAESLYLVADDTGLHGIGCADADPDRPITRQLIADVIVRNNWCDHCATTDAAHTSNWRLRTIGAAHRYTHHTGPFPTSDLYPAARERQHIRELHRVTPHPLFDAALAAADQFLNIDTARTELLNIAVVANAAAHLDPTTTPVADDGKLIVPDVHADRFLFRIDAVHDAYATCGRDPHATIDRLAHAVGARPDSVTAAHAAIRTPDPTCHITVSSSFDVVLFSESWPNTVHHRRPGIPSRHVMYIPAAIADLTWRKKDTVSVSCDPDVVTDTFLHTCAQLISEQVPRTTQLDGHTVRDIVRTTAALYR